MTEQETQIPADAHVLVVIAGAATSPSPRASEAIADWVNARAAPALAPNRLLDEEGDAPDFATILADWGITVRSRCRARSRLLIGVQLHTRRERVRASVNTPSGPFTRSASVPLDPLVTCSLRVDSQAPEMPRAATATRAAHRAAPHSQPGL